MSDALDERLSEFRKNCGDREIVAFLERREPQDKDAFIQRLYADIHAAIDELQSLAHELVNDDETKLRSRLLTVLRAHGYRALGESNHRGHTDLLVENSHVRVVWIGETKKHDNSSYGRLTKGMKQLYSRYTSGTHRDSGLIVFVFSKDAAAVVETWKSKIEESNLCGLQGHPYDDQDVPLCFWTKHVHDGSGLLVHTKHIFATLHYRPRDVQSDQTR